MLKTFVAALCAFLPSAPTRFLFRLCGHRIGRNVRIPVLTYVRADKMVIGDDTCIRKMVYIDVRKLTLGANTIVSYGTQIKGDASFSCGDNAFFGVHSIVHCAEDVSFGFYSGLGPRCTVYTHGSFLPVTMGYPAKFAPVVIEEFVWIGMSVNVMPGAHVERNCIINPGVVVQGRIREGSIVQLAAEHISILSLGRLQKLSKKPVAFYHEWIVSSFLTSRSIDFKHAPGSFRWTLADGRAFVSHPDSDRLELVLGHGRAVAYDLSGFYADPSRDALHREFLDFIRLRFGLTLRTKYRA